MSKTADAIVKGARSLTKKQIKWCALVASGGYSDCDAYQEAYQCNKATANSAA